MLIAISLAVSSALNLIGMLANYLNFRSTERLLLSVRKYGGECMLEIGCGWRVFHTYAMREGQQNTATLHFEPISLVLQILLLAAVIFGILVLIKKLTHR
ncbi:MAG: hypothetical protein IJK64_04035 [Clostridia bacterium]|nr:hypothetical protein [Clostridia bacterium]